MELVNEKRLNVGEIVQSTKAIYTKYFKLFITLSLISILIINISALVLARVVEPYFENGTTSNFLVLLVVCICAIIVIYFSIRIKIVIIMCVKNIYLNNEMKVSKVINNSKAYIWKVFLAYLGLVFIMIVPGVFFSLSKIIGMPLVVRLIFMLIGLCAAAFVLVKNGMAPSIRVLKAEEESAFGHNSILVDGHFKEMLAIVFISNLGFMLNYLVNYIAELQAMSVLTNTIMTSVVTLFYLPIEIIILVLTYYKLTELYNEKNEQAEVDIV